jgi:hypothetical protein
MRLAILVALLAVVLGTAACQQKPTDNPTDNRPNRTVPR